MRYNIHDTGHFYPRGSHNYCPQNAAAKTTILDVKCPFCFASDSFRVKSFNLVTTKHVKSLSIKLFS